MKPFLQQVARAMLDRQGTALRNTAVVLPSQRAGLYLRNWLAKEAGGAMWSPQLFTIGSFLEEVAGMRTLPMEELLLEGYEAYRQAEGTGARDFSEFLQWAPTTLADISEADAHLVPLESYYRDLRSWEEIHWTFNDDPLSEGQQRMVRFWAMVGRLHTALNQRLRTQQGGTAGLVERTSVERAAQAATRWDAIWFVGLNAFTPAQESVLRKLIDADKVVLAWDADRYYLDRPDQEAGLHLRKAIAAFGPGVVPAGDALADPRKNLRAVRAPHEAAQAWCAARLLDQTAAEDRGRTAVVLADGSLLQPLLEALPPDIGPVNVTMGLPIAQLPVGALLGALHRLHAGLRPGMGFFHADVERFLAHPMLRHAATERAMKHVLDAVRGQQRVFIPPQEIQEIFRKSGVFPHAADVFADGADVRVQMTAATAAALAWAKQAADGNAFATEQVFQASLVLHRIHRLLDRYTIELDRNAYATVFTRLLRNARLGLFGEPLAGVQVMGMLEARALDPQRLIVLGAQEGTLPAATGERSYIPFELRRAHGMPLREGNDAVQAYNFMRMLQRAEDAVMVWPEGAEPTGPSRFILQLKHELLKEQGRQLNVQDARVATPPVPGNTVSVRKGLAALEALRKRLEKGLSPSAIGDWLRCPLDFHFKHVLGLRESTQAGVRIADNILGEALHAAVEQVYRPMLGSPMQPGRLAEAAEGMEDLLALQLGPHLAKDQLAQGQSMLQFRMAARAAKRFLLDEAATLEKGSVVTPLALEQDLVGSLEAASQAIGSPVRLKGRLDRLDRANGCLRILDLKSGKVEPGDLHLRDLDPEGITARNRYAVQLLIYAFLFLQQHPAEMEVQAGILPLRRAASSEPLLLSLGGRSLIHRDDLPAIEALLTSIILRIMDPALPAEHDPDSRYCRFCLQGAH